MMFTLRLQFTRVNSRSSQPSFPRGKSQSLFTRVSFQSLLVGLLLLVSAPVLAQEQASDGAAADSLNTATVNSREVNPERVWWLGAAIGSPQILALTVERRVTRGFHLQGHAGTALLANSVGVRALVMPVSYAVTPYLFGGAGYFFSIFGWELDDDDHYATYAWWGGGMRFPIKRLLFFVEIGDVIELDNDENVLPDAGAAGVLFLF